MTSATFALFLRTLRVDERSWHTHLLRFGLVGVTLTFLVTAATDSYRGAPGLAFFWSIAYINLTFITLAGLSFFASPITEEKEEGTLGLLRMTTLDPVAMLLGKSSSRLIMGILLLLVQLPFTLLAITLGGVAIDQIIAAYITLAAYTIFVANAGLFFSVISPRTAAAARWMVCLLLAFLIGPWVFMLMLFLIAQTPGGPVPPGYLTWVMEASPFQQMATVLSTGQEPVYFSYQVISNLVAGAVFFVLAWICFEPFNRDEKPAAPARSILFARARKGSSRRRRAWHGAAALAWKDYQFLSGGKRGAILRIIFYTLITLGVGWLIHRNRYMSYNSSFDYEAWSGSVMMIFFCIFVLEAATMAARIFHEEHRWKTLVTVSLLPISTGAIAYAKIAGTALGLIPAAIFFFIGGMIHPELMGDLLEEIASEEWPWIIGMYVVFGLHMTAWLSLYLKRGALAATLAAMFLITMIFSSCVFGVMRVGQDGLVTLFVLGMLAASIAVIAMHVATGIRLNQLAAE